MCRELHIIDESIYLDPFIECGHCEKECCSKCNYFNLMKKLALENAEIKKEIEKELNEQREAEQENKFLILQNKVDFLQNELNTTKMTIYTIVQQLNLKGMGIRLT